jgi:type IV pilus assembly protein PilA
MLSKLRRRVEDEKGFTLIELLVVILIIGILAAIAIPAFLNQRQKAYDSQAKSNIRTAQTAEETYATDNNGAYTNSVPNLVAIEPTLGDTGQHATLTIPSATGTGYTLTATVTAGPDTNAFTLTSAAGSVTRTCATAGTGGCPTGGSW